MDLQGIYHCVLADGNSAEMYSGSTAGCSVYSQSSSSAVTRCGKQLWMWNWARSLSSGLLGPGHCQSTHNKGEPKHGLGLRTTPRCTRCLISTVHKPVWNHVTLHMRQCFLLHDSSSLTMHQLLLCRESMLTFIYLWNSCLRSHDPQLLYLEFEQKSPRQMWSSRGLPVLTLSRQFGPLLKWGVKSEPYLIGSVGVPPHPPT